MALVLAVCVQVYLIGSYIFGAGQAALDAYRSMGWTVHGFATYACWRAADAR